MRLGTVTYNLAEKWDVPAHTVWLAAETDVAGCRQAARQLIALNVEPVRGTRGLTRSDLARNRATAPIEVDPTNGRVTLAGRALEIAPVAELPLNRRYFLR